MNGNNTFEVMKMQLTQKETALLKELKGQEKLCAEKYEKYSEAARDPQLKDLFSRIAAVERGHISTLAAIENGSAPAASGAAQPAPAFTAAYKIGETEDKKNDCYLCTDALATEKHASGLYDTCVFEFTQNQLRAALNHIQTEEQGHGKMIYDYMSANAMYG